MTDEQIAKGLQKLPPEVQLAVVNCLPNIPYGCDWGLCTNEDVKDYIPYIKENKNLYMLPVQGGVVLNINMKYLIELCNSACKGLITEADLRLVKDKKKEVYESFQKFIEKARKNNNKTRGCFGIYCINSVASIRIDDTDYPAFRLNLASALEVMAQYGLKIVIDGVSTPAGNVLAKVRANDVECLRLLSKSMRMSPTRTGVFIKYSV